MKAEELEALVERLRTFEGSDELGNGDFTLCTQAADALTELIRERDAMRAALERIRQETHRQQLPITSLVHEIADNALKGTQP